MVENGHRILNVLPSEIELAASIHIPLIESVSGIVLDCVQREGFDARFSSSDSGLNRFLIFFLTSKLDLRLKL